MFGVERSKFSSSYDHRFAFGHHEDAFVNAMFARGFEQAGGRFIEWLEAETESAVVHRDQHFCAELDERLDSLLRVHVHLPASRRVISADRQQGDVDLVAVADFFESREIRAVAAMKDRAAIHSNDEPAEAAVAIGQKTRSPMMRRSEWYLGPVEFDSLPFVELVDNREAEPMNEITDAIRYDDRLISRHSPQSAPVEMIEVRVRDQHIVDRGEMMNFEARPFQALDHLEPFRPVRVDQNIRVARLEQK